MLKLILIASLAYGNVDQETETTFNDESPSSVAVGGSCYSGLSDGAQYFSTNRRITIRGKTYEADTQISVIDGDGENIAQVESSDGTGAYKDEDGSYDEFPIQPGDIDCRDLTRIEAKVDQNGEVTFEDYSLPIDFQVAGSKKQPKKRKKKSGVTHCYRAVKAAVGRRVKLTGEAAYMAAPQLVRAGFKKYSYNKAPKGAICVFAAGGIKTASGGQKYGHIGIKGRGGVINPESGFKLKRPFIGCYSK